MSPRSCRLGNFSPCLLSFMQNTKLFFSRGSEQGARRVSSQEQLCAWPAWATQPSGLSWDTGTTSHSCSARFQLLEAPVLEHRIADSSEEASYLLTFSKGLAPDC